MADVRKITQEIEEKKSRVTKEAECKNSDRISTSESRSKGKEKEFQSLDDESKTDYTGSPLLDQTTKIKLLRIGQSLDSKLISEALGFIDIRMLLKCFAKAVSRHIDFSKGYLFFEDMKKYSTMKDKMKFTYNLNKNMKIDMERLK